MDRWRKIAHARGQALYVIHTATDATWMAGAKTKKELNETIELIDRIKNGVSDAYGMNKNDEGEDKLL